MFTMMPSVLVTMAFSERSTVYVWVEFLEFLCASFSHNFAIPSYGRMQVEWTEINAAWGQTLLLLYTIARKLDYTFEKYVFLDHLDILLNSCKYLSYRLVPMGSFSRIEKTTGDKANYELYGSGDLHFGRLLHNRRFDIAMVAFLDCLKHLMDHIKLQDASVDFPHQYVRCPHEPYLTICSILPLGSQKTKSVMFL